MLMIRPERCIPVRIIGCDTDLSHLFRDCGIGTELQDHVELEIGILRLDLLLTSAEVFDEATAASNASRYSRVCLMPAAPLSSFGSLWPAITVVGWSAAMLVERLDPRLALLGLRLRGPRDARRGYTMSPATTVLSDGIQTYELSASSPWTPPWISSVWPSSVSSVPASADGSNGVGGDQARRTSAPTAPPWPRQSS